MNKNRKTIRTFRIEMSSVNPDIDLRFFKYINDGEKSKCMCVICNFVFHNTPNRLLRGQGCPACNPWSGTGLKGIKTTLYCVKINNFGIYKIGITVQTLKERFRHETHLDFDTVWEQEFACGVEAYKMEQKLMKLNCDNSYSGEKILRKGNTELFIKEVKQCQK